jgi:hypothetical protein
MPNVRVNQSVVELITLANPNVRVNQSVLELMILPLAVTIACGNPPQASLNAAYSYQFPASEGEPPYTFAITSGSLPPGLTLDA